MTSECPPVIRARVPGDRETARSTLQITLCDDLKLPSHASSVGGKGVQKVIYQRRESSQPPKGDRR